MEALRLALFFGCPVLNLRPLLSSSSDGWYTVHHVSAYLKAFELDKQPFARLVVRYVRRNSKQSNGVEPLCKLLKSTLDDFLTSDHNYNYLQLPRLLSKFKSIDHEENISSCIVRVVALWGTFENCPVGGGKLDPCSLILIWYTGASYG